MWPDLPRKTTRRLANGPSTPSRSPPTVNGSKRGCNPATLASIRGINERDAASLDKTIPKQSNQPTKTRRKGGSLTKRGSSGSFNVLSFVVCEI